MGSISSTLNSINASLLSEIQAFSASGVPSDATSTTGTSEASASPDQVNLSQAGTLFQQLQQLQTSNPAEFKQVLTDAATKLQAAASQQTDPNAATFLDNLSSKFQTAASTGDLSALNPQSSSAATSGPGGTGAAHGHHHGHHGGGGGNDDSSTSSSSTSASQTAQNELLSILSSLGITQSNGSQGSGQAGSSDLSSGSDGGQIQNLLAAFVTGSAGGGVSA